MSKEFVYVNGNILHADEAVIPVKDQAVLYGWGVFETIRVYDSIPLMLFEHLERMSSAAVKLEIIMPDTVQLMKSINDFINETRIQNAVLRITVTKGETHMGNVLITQRPVSYTSKDYENGFTLKSSTIKRNPYSPLTYMKTLNYMDSILARKEALDKGFNEALILNTSNFICECSMSNIFFVKENKLYTPAEACGLLSGIVRKLIKEELAGKCNLEVIEGEFTMDELLLMEEIFITNSVMQIMPVVKVDNSFIGNGTPGNKTKELIDAYEDYIMYKTQE